MALMTEEAVDARLYSVRVHTVRPGPNADRGSTGNYRYLRRSLERADASRTVRGAAGGSGTEIRSVAEVTAQPYSTPWTVWHPKIL